ncbi:hypothetical protein COCNU_12G005270 [Cocos nucifera]|uniref:Complex 1 LYR protein domain-containing protein n=1 Tax=Cocos nucifera TaxID=13894 RepID=A0A8K0IRJ4_COCNU|nr:hypothetical protein COCNU_12G005270 [Cocos nucifera]
MPRCSIFPKTLAIDLLPWRFSLENHRHCPPRSPKASAKRASFLRGLKRFQDLGLLDHAVRVFAASNGVDRQEPMGPFAPGESPMASPAANLLQIGSLVSEKQGTMQVAKVYRQLLKAVDKHIGKDGGKRHFRDFIIEEFRKNANLSDQAAVQNKVKLAYNYTFLLNSVHHHKELLLSYNIAVDRSDEMKKILNKSAASVGLHLPDVYQA